MKNQFFTSIFTPDAPASTLVTRRVKLLTALPDFDPNNNSVDVPVVIP